MKQPERIKRILTVVDSALARLGLPSACENEFFTLTPSSNPEEVTLSFYKEGAIPFELIFCENSFYFIVDGVVLPAYYDMDKAQGQLFDLEDDVLSLFIYKTVVFRSEKDNKVSFFTEDDTFLGSFIQAFPAKAEFPDERETVYFPICPLSPEEREELLYQKEKEMAASFYKEEEVRKIKEKRKVSLPEKRIIYHKLGCSLLGLVIVVILAYAINPQYVAFLGGATLCLLVLDELLSRRRLRLKEYPAQYSEEDFERGLRITREQLGGTLLTYGDDYVMLFCPTGYTMNKTGEILYILKDNKRLHMTQISINDSTLKRWRRQEDTIHLILKNMENPEK